MNIETRISKFRISLFYILIFLITTSNVGFWGNGSVRKLVLNITFVGLFLFYLSKHNTLKQRFLVRLFGCTIFILIYLIGIEGVGLGEDWIIFTVLDVGMIMIGSSIAKIESELFIKRIHSAFFAISSLACLYYITSFDTSEVYGFALKNSQAPIFLTSLLLLILKKDILPKYLKLAYIMLHIYTLLNLNSRSSVVSVLICALLIIYRERNSILKFMRKKIGVLVAFLSIVGILYYAKRILNIISNALRLNVLDQTDINHYSAGRIPMIEQGLSYFNSHEILGIYSTNVAPSTFYIESFPFEVLVKFGLLGFSLYLLWFFLIYKQLKISYRMKIIDNSGVICFIAILIISLFEAHAPIGPGTSFSMAWLIIGYHCSSAKNNYNK